MRYLGFFAVYVLYAVSFFLPAFRLTFDRTEILAGWVMFRFPLELFAQVYAEMGWQAVWFARDNGLLGMFGFRPLLELAMWLGWLANPMLWIAICCSTTRYAALASLVAGLALLLGLSPIVYGRWIGGPEVASQFLAGYYLWLASMAMMCVINAREFYAARDGPCAACRG